LNVKVTPRFDGRVSIRYFGEDGERVPRDRSNLVVQAMETALRSKGLEFAGADFEIYSSVPVAVGLGSSTAAVLAGLIAADQLFHLQLDEKSLLNLATTCESRADSLRAAWLGGFVACADGSYRQSIVKEQFVLDVVVPETSHVTSVVRQRPADSLSSRPAVGLSDWLARAGVRGSACAEATPPPTSEKFVPGLREALEVRSQGLLGVFVCGSGPALGILQEEFSGAVKLVQDCFSQHGVDSRHILFHASNSGAREWNGVPPDLAVPRPSVPGPLAKKISLIPV
jgi:homoserine kinase